MVFPNIEKIKQDYTDKYVVVDAQRPELARFGSVVGQVKTVNMSGRALVEFLDYHLNIGWFDIELAALKVVDKPQPAEKKPESKTPPGEAASAAVAKTPAAAAPPAATGKPSTADILAKLKGGGGAAPAAKAKTAQPAAAATPGKVERSKMSVADMLAAARGGANPPGEAASAAASSPTKSEPTPAAATKADFPKAETKSAGVVKVDKTSMSVEAMVAYCREHDGK